MEVYNNVMETKFSKVFTYCISAHWHAVRTSVDISNKYCRNIPCLLPTLAVVGKEGSTVRESILSLWGHLRTHRELFATIINSTIAKASLGYLDSQGVNGDAVIPLWYVKLGHNGETVARFSTLGRLASGDV